MGRLRSQFVSLRASLDLLDRQGAAPEPAATSSLVALMRQVDEHLLAPVATKVSSGAPDLATLRQHLDGPHDEPRQQAFSQALASTAECIRHQLAGTAELNQLVELLQSTLDRVTHSSDANGDTLAGVAEGLRLASNLNSVQEFRALVLAQAASCAQLIETMREENRQLRQGLETELGRFRHRLDEAERAAYLDPLTGLANRRALENQANQYLEAKTTFSLLVLDLDRFKSINDRFGHAAGDQALVHFAERLRRQLRNTDLAVRWGGDEFVVLLPIKLPEAMARARQMEKSLRCELMIPLEKPVRLQLSATVGVAECRPGETLAGLFARADSLLMASKSAR